MITVLLIALLCVIADFVTKYFVARLLAPIRSVTVIEGVLDFSYVENRGMAFGWLADHRGVFMVLSAVMLLAVAIFAFRYRKSACAWLKIACALVLGGGIGNMIDRVRLGYVIDFIDVRLFDFWKWVFNIADACVCVGVFMLAIYLIYDSFCCNREKKCDARQIQDDCGSEDDGNEMRG